jgi:hypothetical protein
MTGAVGQDITVEMALGTFWKVPVTLSKVSSLTGTHGRCKATNLNFY